MESIAKEDMDRNHVLERLILCLNIVSFSSGRS